MKKLIAMVLALMLALTVCSAFAEETVTLKIAHIGPTTGAAALYGLLKSPWMKSTPRAANSRLN